MRINRKKALFVFKECLAGIGLKENTIKQKLKYCERFFKYLNKQGRKRIDVREITREEIKGYVKVVKSEIYSEITKRMMLISVKQFFSSLYRNEMLLINPGEEIEYMRRRAGEKKEILSRKEMEKLLDGIDIERKFGLRDRTMLELIYSTGLRAGEVTKLEIKDIDFNERMIMIRCGKMGKDRIVPISHMACKFLKKYIECKKGKKERTVFGKLKGPMKVATINERFKKWAKETGVYREKLTVHSIRHSTATHLLENGANLRYVQELLGHESIETTVVYTYSLYESLRRIYRTYHPRENEYYQEISREYMERIAVFRQELIKRRCKTELEKKRIERKRKGL